MESTVILVPYCTLQMPRRRMIMSDGLNLCPEFVVMACKKKLQLRSENDLFCGPIYTQFNDNRSLDQDGNFAGNFREWSTRGTDWQPGLLITSTFVDLAFPSPFPGKIKSCSTNRTLSALASSSFYLTEEESGSILLSQGVQGTTRVLVFNFTPRKCGDIISQ